MNENSEFGYKIRQILNHGADTLDSKVATRLHQARQNALELQRRKVSVRGFAGMGEITDPDEFSHRLRVIFAAVALSIGLIGTYYWTTFEKTLANEEIDSEILADELPPSVYLDRGFQAWLERDSPISSQ